MIRKILTILTITLVHFGAILGLTYLGLHVVGGGVTEAGTLTLGSKALVWTSRILYFPIVTLSLFPRDMFPGPLVFVPILLNSFVWGIFLYASAVVIDRFRD